MPAARPRSVSRSKAWAAAAEAASRSRDASELRAARAVYRSLPVEAQLALVEETVQARSHDFVHCFDNVVAVHAGVRRRRDRQGRERLGKSPCMIFVVRRKWPTPDHGRNQQRLPSELLAHADVGGQRQLCAIPTDVQHAAPLVKVRDQALTAVRVTEPDGGRTIGTLAWPLRVGSQLMVLAPLHVLSPLPDLQQGGLRGGAQVTAFGATGQPLNGGPLLTALDQGGCLKPWPMPSFDAQLAVVHDQAGLVNAFRGLRLSPSRPFLRSPAEVLQASTGAGLQILVPDNLPLEGGIGRGKLAAVYARNITRETPLEYRVQGVDRANVSHLLVIELQIKSNKRTRDGDSGSAVVTPAADGGYSLVGMHIAGNSELGLSFMLPAWQLFDRLFYSSIADGEIQPVTA